jgi:hypothetical protein
MRQGLEFNEQVKKQLKKSYKINNQKLGPHLKIDFIPELNVKIFVTSQTSYITIITTVV